MSTKKRVVKCLKLKQEAEGLDMIPYPGPLGEKIYHHISKKAWSEWLNYLTISINERRLAVNQPDAKEILKQKMVEFLNLDERV